MAVLLIGVNLLALPVAANQSPTASREYPSTPQYPDTGDSIEFKIYCSDPDSGDDLRSHWRLYRDGSLVDDRDNDADIWGNEGDDAESFTFNYEATYELRAWCDDENGGTSNTIVWDIYTENQAPSISRTSPSSSSVQVEIGSSQEFKIYCSDPDSGDDLRSHWRVYQGSSLVDSRDNDADIVGNEGDDAESFSFDQEASYDVDVWCDDENGGTTSTLRWDVTASSTNQAPSISRTSPSSSSVQVEVGSSQEFKIYCSDPDSGDDLRSHWRVYQGSSLVDSRDNDADIVGNEGNDAESFSFDQEASYDVDVWCDDENGGTTSTLRWEVTTSSTNQAPSITRVSPSSSSIQVEVGSGTEFKIECTDPDSGDDLRSHWRVYQGSSLVDSRDNDADLIGNHGDDAESFSLNEEGTYRVEVWCDDENGGTTTTLQWDVTASSTNQAPSISRTSPSSSSVQVEVGSSQEFEIYCSDPDSGDDLRAFWRLYRNGNLIDSRDNDADILGNEGDDAESFSFDHEASFTVETWCMDEEGTRTSQITWEIEVMEPTPPSATRDTPADGEVSLPAGPAFEFTGYCRAPSNTALTGSLSGIWSLTTGNTVLDTRSTSHDMGGKEGWDSESFRFREQASYRLEFTCEDQRGQTSNTVGWDIQVEGESQDVGTLLGAISAVRSLDSYLQESSDRVLDLPDSSLGLYVEEHPGIYRHADTYQKVSRDHQSYLEALIEKLAVLLGIQEKLEDMEVGGISAWDLLAKSQPSVNHAYRAIRAANFTASQLDAELEEIERASMGVESSIEQYARRASDDDRQRVLVSFDEAVPEYLEDASYLEATSDALDSMASRVRSLSSSFSAKADLPLVGRMFEKVAEWLTDLADRIEEVSANFESAARLLREDARLMNEAPRQEDLLAPIAVPVPGWVVVLAVALGAGFFRWSGRGVERKRSRRSKL